MEYNYEINEDRKLFDVVVSGQVDSADFTKLSIKMRILALELGYAILFDYRKAEVYVSIIEVYFWLSDHSDKVSGKFRSIPIVNLINENNEELFEFMDLSWSNAGVVVKSFKERSDAEKWLANFNREDSTFDT